MTWSNLKRKPVGRYIAFASSHHQSLIEIINTTDYTYNWRLQAYQICSTPNKSGRPVWGRHIYIIYYLLRNDNMVEMNMVSVELQNLFFNTFSCFACLFLNWPVQTFGICFISSSQHCMFACVTKYLCTCNCMVWSFKFALHWSKM